MSSSVAGMIAGTAAFERETPIETLYAILKDAPAALGARPDLSPDLAHVIRHCLEKNANERFQSARDLAFVLEFSVRTSAPPARLATRPRHLFEAFLNLF